MKKALPAIFVVVALTLIVVTGVLAYNTGVQTGTTQAQNIRTEFLSTRSAGTQNGGGFAQGGNQGNNPAAAGAAFRGGGIYTVKSVQGNTIQVTAQDGSAVTVNVNAQTVIEKTTTGVLTDVQPGMRIIVAGGGQGGSSSSASSGAPITARTIQIQPGQ
jgi:hypothetical protein